METAATILVLGGLANLFHGLVTGLCAGMIRARQPITPKYLLLTHQGSLMWAPLLFGLVIVLPLSELSSRLQVVAASAMVVASVLLNAKDTWHWLRGTKDEFAEKPAPLYLGHGMALAYLIGVGLFSWGVLRRLV